MNRKPSNILLTGKPGVGKTTLVQTLCRQLEPYNPTGFYTTEVRDRGKRLGFELVGLDGARMTLAHVNMAGEDKVGKYNIPSHIKTSGILSSVFQTDCRAQYSLDQTCAGTSWGPSKHP